MPAHNPCLLFGLKMNFVMLANDFCLGVRNVVGGKSVGGRHR